MTPAELRALAAVHGLDPKLVQRRYRKGLRDARLIEPPGTARVQYAVERHFKPAAQSHPWNRRPAALTTRAFDEFAARRPRTPRPT